MKTRKEAIIVLPILFVFVLGVASGYCGNPIAKQKTDQGTEYITGGVGIDERDEMKVAAENYHLSLIFANAKGEYLSAVAVKIKDSKGKLMLDAFSDGPWLFVKTAPGTYRVSATYQGVEQTRTEKVGGGLNEVVFYWKANP